MSGWRVHGREQAGRGSEGDRPGGKCHTLDGPIHPPHWPVAENGENRGKVAGDKKKIQGGKKKTQSHCIFSRKPWIINFFPFLSISNSRCGVVLFFFFLRVFLLSPSPRWPGRILSQFL